MFKLPEFKPYIPETHYYQGSVFNLKGEWAPETKEVSLEIVSYTDSANAVYKGNYQSKGQTGPGHRSLIIPQACTLVN